MKFHIQIALIILALAPQLAHGLVKSKQSGSWSDAKTWEGDRVPHAGDSVQIRPAHRVIYDVKSADVIRAIHVAGRLQFATDRDTTLSVGLIRVQGGEEFAGEAGFDCHADAAPSTGDQAVLQVGSADQPIDAQHNALIRLTYVEGMDKESCPAIVACGGRMDFFGAPLDRTWVKLAFTSDVGDDRVYLQTPVSGWKVGDRVILTATSRQFLYKKTFTPSVADAPLTEERTITAIDRHLDHMRLVLDEPLKYPHRAEGEYRGEVANLSRNVVVESADPKGVRGHTMYHNASAGSIAYAEFRHLGKKGVLGRYPIHFHVARDTMRGSSVVGASIWDSDNHLMTIHGTDYLVVRDCVGYRSAGHGIFLEDGTEVFNVFDRNLVVQSLRADPLPEQVLNFDTNDGSGFWWANSLNTFTNNVAVECDQNGYRFEAVKTEKFDPNLQVPQPDGSARTADIRTLPFVRFEGNEAHSIRRFGFNLGGFNEMPGYDTDAAKEKDSNKEKAKQIDVAGVGPDRQHPFVLRNTKLWDCHWAFHAGSPMVVVNGMDIFDCQYGLWRSVMQNHVYHDLSFKQIRSDAIFFTRTGNGAEIAVENEPAAKDDLPPSTVITSVSRDARGQVSVRGTCSDNNEIAGVVVNDIPVRATRENFATWEVLVPPNDASQDFSARATDAAGNIEPRPHVIATRKMAVANGPPMRAK